MTASDTPLLLIAWRRPHTLRQVINAIRPVAPTRLYVACDGPNSERPAEAEKVSATRQVIEQEINWPCQIERLYSDVNQGCRVGVSRAISWFFEQVEEGIILEDDCVPHPDFIPYCTTLLERYRHDTRVWCISGNNFEDGPWRKGNDYFFTKIPMIWGWATWRSRWNHYDDKIEKWDEFKMANLGSSAFPDASMRSYWFSIWDQLSLSGKPDTWDYQWVFICVSNGGLTALPRQNLVSNVGFGADATHTTGFSIVRKTNGLQSLTLIGPKFVLSDACADKYIFDYHFAGKWRRFHLTMLGKSKDLVEKLVRALRSYLF
ncbi:nucleotide-diphospho-sugar transferase [Synechococcus sp. UW140]|uniref:nucleotide-diphospho-sugar transferase n=1 Tax=Synechococcus sp. UW140 TaxID=368503 RepID=UPI003137CECA